MPRPARRAAPTAQNGEGATATPTRNPITATIPPFMLDTPDRAPFIDTQQPTHNPNESIVPPTDANTNTAGPRLNRNVALPNQDVHAHGDNPGPDGSQASTHALTAPSEVGEQSYLSSVQQEAEDARALVGLREIGGLATWTLSSAKPGCGLAQLRSPDLRLFWQSDGPQPHVLSLHYPKVVSVSKLRMYLDYELDESYTPVETKFYAGMSEGALVEFGNWACVEETDPVTGETRSSVENVKGWIDIDLTGVGGRDRRFFQAAEDDDAEGDREAGDVLKAMVIQMRVCSNHQNGKDCHVRGFQVFARDESAAREGAKIPVRRKKNKGTANGGISDQREAVGVQMADWMGEPEIRSEDYRADGLVTSESDEEQVLFVRKDYEGSCKVLENDKFLYNQGLIPPPEPRRIHVSMTVHRDPTATGPSPASTKAVSGEEFSGAQKRANEHQYEADGAVT